MGKPPTTKEVESTWAELLAAQGLSMPQQPFFRCRGCTGRAVPGLLDVQAAAAVYAVSDERKRCGVHPET